MSNTSPVRRVFRLGDVQYTESWPENKEAGLKPGHVLVRGHEDRAELRIVAVQDGRVYARPLAWYESWFGIRLD